MKRLMLPLVAASLVFAAGSAQAAYWFENFDSYINGQMLSGVGGWSGWDNSMSAAGVVSNARSKSPSNSLAIIGTSDAVRQFSGITSGQWTFVASLYLPSATTGTCYFIMLDQYAVGGPNDWAVQLPINLDTGLITDDNVADVSLNLVRDSWADIKVVMDLDADTRTIYYNDQLLSTRAWTTGTGSVKELQAIDLFGNGITGTVYYDNLAAVPEPATFAVLGVGVLALLRRRRRQ